MAGGREVSCHADEEANVLLAAAADDAAEDGVARVEDEERELIGVRFSRTDKIQVSDTEEIVAQAFSEQG